MSRHRKQPSLFSQLFASRIFQAILIIAIVAMCWQVYERYQVERRAAERLSEMQTTYDHLESRRTELAIEVKNLEDPFGIESEIRRNFDVAREGEEIVIILDSELVDTPDRPRPTTTDTVTTDNRWYQFWR